ncbi:MULTISPECIES: PLD nuclease N-terminal domain-containing protein [Amycolatopsis]|uniref:Cardiolipin synthase N-terminal domain-containing protein n=1 Tax=Amycolatopsis tucumanensis TaxID=401106 RepID=A0ABP7HSL0_9PSEU|nr:MULTISPECIES: PLD nuclease N-terminal domain-containing protein [Amycolatopsis]MCF6422079.1 PLD nuclease N-terminal domain-containing protein [Amycolatopsis tucumanensis]
MTHRITALAGEPVLGKPWNYVLAALIIALVVACVVLIVGALVSILRSPQSGGMKFVWVVFVLVAPYLGSALWFLIGRKAALTAS